MASRLRCLFVALVVTALAAPTAVLLGRLLTAGAPGGAPVGAEDAIVRLCLALLLGCTAWGWVGALAAVAEAWRGAPAAPRGLLRRLVFAACGVAVTGALMATSAHAADPLPSPLSDPLAGLPLPQRPVDGPRHPGASPPDARVVVRPGDTLWGLAATRLPGAGDAAVSGAWQRVYRANRVVVGPDPDLIHPGQVLDLRPTTPKEHR